ncbi:MAG: ATP-binding protein [Nitrospirota bacterium]
MKTIHFKLGLMFNILVLFILFMAGGTYFVLSHMRGASEQVNLAGRQRMLSTKMMLEAAKISAGADAAVSREKLRADIEEFERVLGLLRSGGPERASQFVDTADQKEQMDRIEARWKEAKDVLLPVVQSDAPVDVRRFLRQADMVLPPLVREIDAGVGLLSRHTEEEVRNLLYAQQAFLVLAIILSIVGWAFVHSRIVRPVREISQGLAGMERTGVYGVALPVRTDDEVGNLATSFNNLSSRLAERTREVDLAHGKIKEAYEVLARHAEELETRVTERTAALEAARVDLERKNEALLREKSFLVGYEDILTLLNQGQNSGVLLPDLLRHLLEVIRGQAGVIHLAHDSADRLEVGAAFGVDNAWLIERAGRRGLPEQVARDKKPIFVEEVPEDYFRVESGVGSHLPRSLALLPLLYADKVEGVLEVAMLTPLDEDDRDYLWAAASQIGIGLHNLAAAERLSKLAAELQAANEALTAQNEELQSQTEELQSQSEELQAQSEELMAQKVELEEKTRSVEEANRLKSEFLANISHEIRTPMNAITGYTDILLELLKGKIDPPMYANLERIRLAAKSLLNLINDILDISKIEAGRLEIQPGACRMHEALDRVYAAIRPQMEKKGLSWRTEGVADLPELWTDEGRLEQILLNILGNAVKFTERGGITVRGRRGAEDRVVVEVHDTGIGIPSSALSHIFEAFRQANGTTTRRYGGTGLGLHIVRELARLLGGEVWAESAEGHGATFSVSLPIRLPASPEPSAAPVLAAGAPPAGRPAPPRRPGGPVLIVEDDPAQRDILEHALRSDGLPLRVAVDGAEAIRMAIRERPSLITLDLAMPGVDGFAVYRALRENPATRDVPVIVLSAAELTKGERERLSGVRGILQKGVIARDELLTLIREILG